MWLSITKKATELPLCMVVPDAAFLYTDLFQSKFIELHGIAKEIHITESKSVCT